MRDSRPCVFDNKLGNIYITDHALSRFSERAWKAGFKLEDSVVDQFRAEFNMSVRMKENVYSRQLRARAKDKTIFFENGVWRFVIKAGFLVTAELTGKLSHFNS